MEWLYVMSTLNSVQKWTPINSLQCNNWAFIMRYTILNCKSTTRNCRMSFIYLWYEWFNSCRMAQYIYVCMTISTMFYSGEWHKSQTPINETHSCKRACRREKERQRVREKKAKPVKSNVILGHSESVLHLIETKVNWLKWV